MERHQEVYTQTTAAKPSRSTARPAAFLIIGGDAINLSSIQRARRYDYWTYDGTRQIPTVYLDLTRGRQIQLHNHQAEQAWAVIEAHKATPASARKVRAAG